MKQYNFTKNSKIFAIVSLVLILAGVVGLIVNGGLNYGIDFTGGTNIQLSMKTDSYEIVATTAEIEDVVKEALGGAEVQAQSMGTDAIVIKTVELGGYLNEEGEAEATEGESDVEKVFSAIEAKYNVSIPEDERNVTTISASTSKKILTDSLSATLLAVVLMLLYITIRFEFLSGAAAVIGLVHNIIIMIGAYALFRLPINNSFVAAVLTIVGYSINNTIVIFDRVRENVKKERKLSYKEIADRSVSQSLARTINSSITTLITIGMLYIMGVNSIREFALPIIIGIVAGTYSSIFLCAPIWVKMKSAFIKKK
ncbi:MAG: protein translocase subunit SecF [Clostridia bacterium]|nr:protein translocase subunit SecF [Clostridia bacterium]